MLYKTSEIKMGRVCLGIKRPTCEDGHKMKTKPNMIKGKDFDNGHGDPVKEIEKSYQ